MLRSRLAIAVTFALAGLVAAVGVAVAQAVTHTAEVRIVAQRLDDGRVEFGLQQREGDGWGDRILPQSRFFPVSSQGRWLSSSAIDVTIEVAAPTPTPTVSGIGEWTYVDGEGIDGTYEGYYLVAESHSGYDWQLAPILYVRCGGDSNEWDDIFVATPFLIHGGDDNEATVRYRFTADSSATSEIWWSDEETDSAVFSQSGAFGSRLAGASGTLYMAFVSHYDYDEETATFDVTGAAEVARQLDCFP